MDGIKEYIIPLTASNLVFGLALVAAFKRPMLARVFFVVCFVGAGAFNSWTAIHDPGAYLTYADLTPLRVYRDFIGGYFSSHVQEIVIAIAIGQELVGIALMLDKGWTRLACIGGMVFGIAITPLGIGSGFPSPFVMAIAFYVLFRTRKQHDFIWNWNQYLA